MTPRGRVLAGGTLAPMDEGVSESSVRDAIAHPLFDLVIVCTGNRARSPIAEAFLRAYVGDLPVRIRSVGTLDVGPAPPLREAIQAADRHGLDIRAHRARCLRSERLDDVDLVVGFEKSHLTRAMAECGAPRARVFALSQLVTLLEAIEPPASRNPTMRAREAIARADALRSRSPGPLLEIADPLGGSRRVYWETVAQIHDLSIRLAAGLFGQSAVRHLADAGLPTTPS
jgi:protein-tyrosine phosphatase